MFKKIFKKIDYSVILLVLLLFAIGITALYSANGGETGDSSEVTKQLAWFAAGVVMMMMVIMIDYDIIGKLWIPIYIAIVVLLVLVLFTKPINGARSWFTIAGKISIQPSEFAKIMMIVGLAKIIDYYKGKNALNKISSLAVIFLFLVIPLLLIIKQPDYGTAMAFITALLCMLFVSGLDRKYIIFAVVAIAVAAPIVYTHLPAHALSRIDSFLHPENDIRGASYNMYQSKLAIGAGQVFGMGLLKGNQTQLGFLYPKTTDFIFAVIGEELGFVATVSIVILYIVLITKAVFIAKTAKDNIGSYIAIGIAGIFLFYMVENIGMTIGLLPITGVPLPFVSYGGSSLITNFICIGLLLNISSRRQKAIFMG